jgi:type IV secretion system protein VirD4
VALDQHEEGKRHFGQVRDIIASDFDRLSQVLEHRAVHPHPLIRTTAARITIKEEKMQSRALASLQSHTHFLDSPAIRHNLSASEPLGLEFEDLKSNKMTVYLLLTADRIYTFRRVAPPSRATGDYHQRRNIKQTPTSPYSSCSMRCLF